MRVFLFWLDFLHFRTCPWSPKANIIYLWGPQDTFQNRLVCVHLARWNLLASSQPLQKQIELYRAPAFGRGVLFNGRDAQLAEHPPQIK